MTPVTLAGLLESRARARGDRPFLIHPGSGRAFTFSRMSETVLRAGRLLRRSGVRKGDRVVLKLRNEPEFFALLFGAARIGAVSVPLDPNLAGPEVDAVLSHCRPAFVAADAGETGLRIAAEPADCEPAGADSADPFLILYTSGTTGRPKGAVLSHGAVMHKIEAIRERFSLRETDRALCLLPVCFGHALIAGCLPALAYGGSFVLCPTFDLSHAATLGALIKGHGVTTFSCVPSVLQILSRFSRLFAPSSFSGLRFVTCASAPLTEAAVAAFESAYGVPVVDCYGLTETASWIASQPLSAAERIPGSVGKALGCRLKILPGSGEIAVRGPSLMRGYYRRRDLTARTLQGGWLKTGDCGRIDAAGNLFLTGRLKDIIVYNAMKVYPREVDEVLCRHPEVLEAATFGLADELLGERVVASVALAPGSLCTGANLVAHCRRYLADYKCPERIRIVPALPRTSRGKIDRAELRRSWT